MRALSWNGTRRMSGPVARRSAAAIVLVALVLASVPAPAAAQTIDLTPPMVRPNSASGPPAWHGALADSLRLLALEHGIRIAFQEKTRVELRGPFVRDYLRSIHGPRTWEDGDNWIVNYLGHPIHGAAATRVWLDHSVKGGRLELSLSPSYWASRGRAAAFGAIYSIQFEFGPVSEASIGNVGMRPGTTGWVDHVVTPAGAFALTVAEDALDRYFVRFVERHTASSFLRASVRMLFSPSWTMANLAEGRAPWHRPTRPIR
jgi:hypothetical protein